EILRTVRSLAATATQLGKKGTTNLALFPEIINGSDLSDRAVDFLSGFLDKPTDEVRMNQYKRELLFPALGMLISANIPLWRPRRLKFRKIAPDQSASALTEADNENSNR